MVDHASARKRPLQRASSQSVVVKDRADLEMALEELFDGLLLTGAIIVGSP
jgi:hypothetical protein